MFNAPDMYVSDSPQERRLRTSLYALLQSAGVAVDEANLMLVPILTRPGEHLLIVPDAFHESVASLADRLGLKAVVGYRGVWVQARAVQP